MANTHSLDLELGSSQYASVADTAPLSITGNATWMAWVKFESSAADATLISKWLTTGDKRSYLINFDLTGAGKLNLSLSSDGAAGTVVTKSSNYSAFAAVQGEWYHVAITYNAAAGTCKFYINGALDATGSGLPTSIFNGDQAFSIGAVNVGGTPATFFDGLVRAVRVYNAELTAQQVLDNLHATAALNSPVGAWELNNDYTDSSGNGATLTPSGSPVFSTTVPFINSGTTLVLQATEVTSATMDDDFPTTNFGNGLLAVGELNVNTSTDRVLIKPDLSSIPSTATINLCLMILSIKNDYADSDRVFNVFRVKRAWTALGATWNKYDGTNDWTTAGAADTTNDREGTAINAYKAQMANPEASTKAGWILDAAKIQEMITGGVFTNNGFLLQVNVETNDGIEYNGVNDATTTLRPMFLIDYTAPASSGLQAKIW